MPHAEKRDGKLTGFWCVSAIVFCCLWSYASGAKEPVGTGNYLLSSCKSAVSDASRDTFNEGYCVGEIAMLMMLAEAEVLGGNVHICPPKGAPASQGVRVVVAFLEANPRRLYEPFSALVYEALWHAWQCKEDGNATR